MQQNRQSDERFRADIEKFLTRYRSRLTKEEDRQFQGTPLVDVKTTILQIQDQQGKAKKMMNLNRINRFLEAMKEWGKVVSIFADSSILVAFVWGPTKALLEVSHDA